MKSPEIPLFQRGTFGVSARIDSDPVPEVFPPLKKAATTSPPFEKGGRGGFFRAADDLAAPYKTGIDAWSN
jgi:hypothetical protein